jgi:CubicO group peptidase (beta-lactamase class C family)
MAWWAERAAASGRWFSAGILAAGLFCGSTALAGTERQYADGTFLPSWGLAVMPQAAESGRLHALRSRLRYRWPTHGWVVSTPEEQGLDSEVLADAMDSIRVRHLPVHSLLVERHGAIVLDAYFNPFADNELHDVASITKSVLSTVVGIAIGEQRFADLNTPVLALYPDSDAQRDGWKSDITLGHLLSMTSGLDCSSDPSSGHNFLQQMEQSEHWASFALERREVAAPGRTFAYCAGNMQVVSAALTRTIGENAASLAERELFAPLGIENAVWPTDRDGNSHGFADLKLQPRDMAKLGYLWLHRGYWEGRQLVPASYLDAAFTPQSHVGAGINYGYGMWVYPQRGHAGGPPDVEANGSGGQRIAVIPSQDMVVVITGSGLNANQVASLLVDAPRSNYALAPNPAGDARLDMRVAEAAAPAEGFAALHAHHEQHVRTAALTGRCSKPAGGSRRAGRPSCSRQA